MTEKSQLFLAFLKITLISNVTTDYFDGNHFLPLKINAKKERKISFFFFLWFFRINRYLVLSCKQFFTVMLKNAPNQADNIPIFQSCLLPKMTLSVALWRQIYRLLDLTTIWDIQLSQISTSRLDQWISWPWQNFFMDKISYFHRINLEITLEGHNNTTHWSQTV